MTYYIHPSHTGYGDHENFPHVHVCFGSKSDKSTQVSVSLTDCKAIVTGRNLAYRQQTEAEDFAKDNQRSLMAEWESKANCDW